MTRRRALGAGLAVLVLAGLVVGLGGLGGGGAPTGGGAAASAAKPAKAEQPQDVVLTPESVDPEAARAAADAAPRSRAQVVELEGAGEDVEYASGSDQVSPGAPSDDEVRAELRDARAQLTKFKRYLGTTAFLRTGPRARVLPDGTAVAPANAPIAVQKVIQAGNAIAKLPYKWGGGHGAWRDDGYDCSGSVSFALAGAGLLEAPMASGGFMSYGAAGPGEWITIYADEGHMFMVVAGLRFDTVGRGRAGTRWQAAPSSGAGMSVRHVPGL